MKRLKKINKTAAEMIENYGNQFYTLFFKNGDFINISKNNIDNLTTNEIADLDKIFFHYYSDSKMGERFHFWNDVKKYQFQADIKQLKTNKTGKKEKKESGYENYDRDYVWKGGDE